MGETDNLLEVLNLKISANLVTEDVSKFAKTCSEMTKLYAKKNHDYGNSFDKGMTILVWLMALVAYTIK